MGGDQCVGERGQGNVSHQVGMEGPEFQNNVEKKSGRSCWERGSALRISESFQSTMIIDLGEKYRP